MIDINKLIAESGMAIQTSQQLKRKLFSQAVKRYAEAGLPITPEQAEKDTDKFTKQYAASLGYEYFPDNGKPLFQGPYPSKVDEVSRVQAPQVNEPTSDMGLAQIDPQLLKNAQALREEMAKKKKYPVNEIVTGASLLAGLLPEQKRDDNTDYIEMGYNPYAKGTGSQALYASGGEVPAGFHMMPNGMLMSDEDMMYAAGGGLSSAKAREILHDGTVHGKPITDRQRRYFGFIAGGGHPSAEGGMNFGSSDAYHRWLAYGHATGAFEKTPGNTPVSIRGKHKNVQHEDGGEVSDIRLKKLSKKQQKALASDIERIEENYFNEMDAGGGLSRGDDYGSDKKPYPTVSSSDFAGGGRSYPIPTRADAVDALRLAGLHGREDVKAKVYAKYPDLKKEAASGIHINPANKGKFTASASHAGMGVQEFASHVLANKEDYSSTQVKRANFARNATKFNHADGGMIEEIPQPKKTFRKKNSSKEITSSLFETDQAAYADSVMNANKNLNFVKRYQYPDAYPQRPNPDYSYSTHLMGSSDGMVYPGLVQLPNGQLVRMDDANNFQGRSYAENTGEIIDFQGNDKRAQWFANNGYKKAKQYKPKGTTKIGFMDVPIYQDGGVLGENVKGATSDLINQQEAYIKSPLYRRRLKQSGVTNTDQIIGERLKNLGKVRIETGDSAQAAYYAGNPFVQLSPKSSEDTAIHEISHITNQPLQGAKAVNQASGKSMSAAETWKFINKAKNINPKLKKEMFDIYASDVNQFGQYTDPSTRVRGYDPHDISVPEMKSDLDAVRHILFKNKITPTYGADITPEMLKKASQLKAVSEAPHFKRFREKFTDEDIISLNNEIAMQQPQQPSIVAKSGKKLKKKTYGKKTGY